MKKLIVLSILFFLMCMMVFAQNLNTIEWGMAIRKYNGSDYESISPHRPIAMENGDEYYIYLTSGSLGYFYVIMEYPDRTSQILYSGSPRNWVPELIINGDDNFIIPSGTGIIRIHVVVSSAPRPLLGQNLNQRLVGARHTAVIDEIQAIGRSISTVAEAPERPVKMGGGTRGEDSLTVFRYGGQNTYVRTVVIRY